MYNHRRLSLSSITFFSEQPLCHAAYVWVILLAPLAPVVADQERLPHLLENEHILSMAFETPHTQWAKPYAKGKTRVLFFTPWYQGGTEGRETIELMQRFDLETDAVYYLTGVKRLLGDENPRPYVHISMLELSAYCNSCRAPAIFSSSTRLTLIPCLKLFKKNS
ncbi:MAG: hypothetical protein ABGX16_02640 [Pirellulales bacterium]